jgi:hypothetical protein
VAGVNDTGDFRKLHALADLVTPMAVRVAATLGVADYLARGAATAPELAAAVGADADTLDRLLRHLAGAGVFACDDDGRYALTPLGTALRADDPGCLRDRLDLGGALGRAELCFVQLLHSVRTGDAAYPEQFGRAFWDDLSAGDVRRASFDTQMGADVAAWAPAILAAYDWGTLGTVVDVGGGEGTLLIELLRVHPQLRGTVVERAETAATARARFAAAGVANRADAVDGSFFDPLPAGAGGYLLTAIVHDWPDDQARAIVRRCAEAARTTGRVFVVEKIGADGASPNTEMDLRMLAYFGGRERALGDLTALCERAGCRVGATHRAGAITILELVAA